MKRKRSTIAVIAFLLIAIGVASYFATGMIMKRYSRERQQLLDRKISNAEMALYYKITQSDPLRMKLMSSDEEVKIVSHLSVPRTIPHDNAKEYLYGLHVEIVDDKDNILWENTYWEKTRATKIKEKEDQLEWESAFYLGNENEMPTDTRLTTVFLSGLFQDLAESDQNGKYLKVALVSEEYERAVIRCYRRVERPDKDGETVWKRLSLATRLELARNNIYSIDMLTKREKRALTKYKWSKISAIGKDYVIEPVYLSDLLAPPIADEVVRQSQADGFLIHGQRSACINVRGDGKLKVKITRAVSEDEFQFPLTIQRIDINGEVFQEIKHLQFSAGASDFGEEILNVPAGLYTYSVKAPVACFVNFYVDRFPEMFVGNARSIVYPVEGWHQIEPEIHKVTYYRSSGFDKPSAIRANIIYNKLYSSSIRIASRTRISSEDAAGVHQYTVHYDLLDNRNRSITRGDYTVYTTASLYDFYYDQQKKIEETEHIPSESEYFHLPLPQNVKTLVLWSEQVADFALYTHYSGNEREIHVGKPDERDVISRRLSNKFKEWYYFRPDNYEELESSGRNISIRWQFRMMKERAGKSEDEQEIEKIPEIINPDVYEEKVTLLEKAELDNGEEYGSDSTFFEIKPNEDVKIRSVDIHNPHNHLPLPMSVIYRDAESSTTTLLVDGVKYAEYPFRDKAGAIRPDEIPQGIRTVRFSNPTCSPRLFVDRAPVLSNSESLRSILWKRKTSYSLKHGRSITLNIRKESRSPKTLNVMVYTETPEECTIRARIHSPISRLPAKVYTADERTYHIKSWENVECFDVTTSQWQPVKQSFTLTLGEDLGAGEYPIQFDLLSGRRALLRFLVMEDSAFFMNSKNPAVLNLIGPGRLKLRLESGEQSYYLMSKRLNHQGEIFLEEKRLESISSEATSEVEFNVPAGLHTYMFSTKENSGCSAYFYVDKYPDMIAGKYGLLQMESEDVFHRITPDLYIKRYYRSLNGDRNIPLIVDLSGYGVSSHRVIRVESRVTGKSFPQSYAVHYKIYKDTGGILSSGQKYLTVSGLADISRFYINLPREAGQLRVWADSENVALAFSNESPEYIRDVYVPEDNLVLKTADVTDSSHNREWYPLPPDNSAELFSAGCLTKIISPKLMIKERDAEPEEKSPRHWRAIIPETYQSTTVVLERTPSAEEGENSSEVSRYYPLLHPKRFYRMPSDEAVRLNVSPPDKITKTPIGVDFAFLRTKTDLTNQFIHLWLNGSMRSAYKLAQRTGSFTVERVPQGVNTFEFRREQKDGAVQLFVDQQPAGFNPEKDRQWQKRTLYGIIPSKPLRLALHKTHQGASLLSVTAYFEAQLSAKCALKATISPAHNTAPGAHDNHTCYQRIYYLKSEPIENSENVIPITEPSLDFRILGKPRRFSIKLHEDMVPGDYEVIFELVNLPRAMLRFSWTEDGSLLLKQGQFGALNLSGPCNVKIEALGQTSEHPLLVTRLSAAGEIVKENLSLKPPGDPGIFIQVGAFASMENAEKLCHGLQRKGYSARIKRPEPDAGKWHRVLVGSFQSEKDAVSAIKSLTDQERLPCMAIREYSISEIAIPPGIFTVRIENVHRNSIKLRFYTDKGDGQLWRMIKPDAGIYGYLECSPQKSLKVPFAPSQKAAQTLRVASRLPLEDNSRQRCDIDYEILDEMEHKIASGRFTIEAARSQDAFYYPTQRHSELPGDVVYRYIDLPQNTAAVSLHSSRRVHFRFYRRFSDFERCIYVPESYDIPETVQIRSELTSDSGWEAVMPECMDGTFQAMKIQTQRQLIDYPEEEETEVAKRESRTLTPADYEEKFHIFEPYQVINPSSVARSKSTYCNFPLNKNVPLNIINYDSPGGQVPVDIQVLYRIPLPLLEIRDAPVIPVIIAFLDNERFADFPIMSPQGNLLTPSVQPGARQLRMEIQHGGNIKADDIELFANQMPADLTGLSVWKLRTVYTLESDKPLEVLLTKSSYKTAALNVIAYYDNNDMSQYERFSILVKIDDGIKPDSPDRASEHYTALIRRYDIENQPSSAFYVNRMDVKPGQGQRFVVPLHDDIPPGEHKISFSLLSGRSVKLRFFIMDNNETY